MMDEHPSMARDYVQKLVNNPELRNKLPATVALLQKRLKED